jgi:hypothetical protein
MTSTERAPERAPAIGFTTIPRALLSAAAGVAYTVQRAVQGDARVRTARRNAWEAVCADRARAAHRAEMRELVAELARAGQMGTAPRTAQVRVGSSPRSKASQASLVGSSRA